MQRIIWRVCLGSLIAMVLSATSAALAMNGEPRPAAQTDDPACSVCHEQTHSVWKQGAHGQAVEDLQFQEAWQSQGEPAACLRCHASGYDPVSGSIGEPGVTCVACHGAYVEGHPAEQMPTYASAATCDQCHVETHSEWQTSRHASVELACLACHDPHGAEIRVEDPSQLCGACHQTKARSFDHNVHSGEGLNCADCHLEPTDLERGEVHTARDHSFTVGLGACTECHDLHNPEEAVMTPDHEPQSPDLTTAQTQTQAEPNPVSPIGYASLFGIFGFAGGMILAPWLEGFYRRMREG